MAEGINAGDVVWKITGEDKALQKALKGSVGLIQKHSKLLIGVGAGITGALGLAAKSAVSFGTAMSRVNTLGVKDLEALSDTVKDVSTRFGLDLKDSAGAAYQAISAGASEAKVPEILEAAAVAAAGGFESLEVAIDLGMGTMNAFGGEVKSVTEVFDLAATAVKLGVTNFGELSASVGKVSPLFAAAGLGADEMFASIAALTKGGVATAEAVTGMRGAITAVIKPTKEMEEAFADVGGPMAIIEKSGLTGFLDALKEKTGGNVKEMGALFGSTEALNAVLALTGSGASDFTEILAEMQSGTSASMDAFLKMAESDPAFAFRQMKATMELLAVEIGEVLLPALKSFMDFVLPMVTGIIDWRKENETLFDGIVIGTGVVGALAIGLGLLGMAIAPLLTVAGFFGLGAAATTAAGVAGGAVGVGGMTTATAALTAALTGPVGLGIAIGATAIALGALTIEFGKTMRAQNDFWKGVKDNQTSRDNQILQFEKLGIVVDRVKLSTMTYAQATQELIRLVNEQNGITDLQTGVIAKASEAEKEHTSSIWGTYTATKGIDEATKKATATSIEWSGAVNRARTAQERDSDAKSLATASSKIFSDATKELSTSQEAGANVSGLSALAFIELIDKNEKARVASEEHTKKVVESKDATEQQDEAIKKVAGTIEGLDTTVKNLDQTWGQSVQQVGRVTDSYNDLAQAAWNAQQQMAKAGGGGGGGGGRPPGMATGGMVTGGGIVDVHKNETLLLPAGAEVLPRQHSPQGQAMMAGQSMSVGDMTIIVNGAPSGLDVRALGELVQAEMGETLFRAARRQGSLVGAAV